MTQAWLAVLRGDVDRAAATLHSIAAALEHDRARVAHQLDRVIDELGRATQVREQTVDPELHARVLEAFRRGRFDELSRRERRHAARQIHAATPAQLHALLVALPSTWPTFIAHCLREFDAIVEGRDAAAFARLLSLAPRDQAIQQQGVPVPELIAIGGPMLVARQLAASTLPGAREALRARGLDPRWSFTACVLAAWAHLWRGAGARFADLWGSTAGDLGVEAMLLPRLRGERARRSWFRDEARPLGVNGSRFATVMFLAVLIRSAGGGAADPVAWGLLTERLLESELGDPRVPPESQGWARLRALDREAYDRFLEVLVSEDLEVFFAHAMQDPRRRTFWSRYLRSIRRTVCVLDRTRHAELTRKLGGADKQLAGAIGRARKFRTTGGESGAQAFCLYFDTVVVVEFSRTGNAAQVYDRADFEKRFERAIQAHQVADHQELKEPKLVQDRIIHRGERWEEAAAADLARLGVRPDVR